MDSRFFISTPIYYVNARPHLGHAYTTIVADIAQRFHAARGQETFFLTGTDEHGDKLAQAAAKVGKTPREYVDKMSSAFRKLWPVLSITPDRFIRTTDEDHVAVVQMVLQKLFDAGEIYFAQYEGLYCYGCERFVLERELIDGKCPDHDRAPEKLSESNYFFRMSQYRDWLIDHVKSNPGFIRPERYANEVLGFLREPLDDLCISRPRSRLSWGIPLPFDADYVTYVWFDALLNYVTALGYPDGEGFKKFWPVAQHVVAKDILKPHGIYWPTMCKAAGIPLYQHLNVHGYWNISEAKMSKSIGNVVEPLAMAGKYGVDAFRYFLAREMSFGLDASFSEEAIINRVNADLANDLGNLFMRVFSMAHKYRKAVVPACDPAQDMNLEVASDALKAVDGYIAAMEGFSFHKAMAAAFEFVGSLNRYVDITAPWTLAKDKNNPAPLDAVLYNLLEGLRLTAAMLYPVMPGTAVVMAEHLGLGEESLQAGEIDPLSWGLLVPGTEIRKAVALFPRIDPEEALPKEEENKGPAVPIKPEISYQDFERMDLRVGKVVAAEAIPKAKKVVKLTVDIGETRSVVAGIALSYSPEELVGKRVVVLANLKPAKLMGIQSQGMVLAAVDEDGARLLTLDGKAPNGTPVK